MITVDSVTFDLTDCSLKEQEVGMKGWMNSHHVAHKIRLHLPPSEWKSRWTFDLTDINAVTAFYERQCADNSGAMLSMDVVIAGGAETLRGFFKYRAPIPDSMAKIFVGILYLPFEKCCFQINIESMEWGTTGLREAAVMLIEQSVRSPDGPDPIFLKDGESLFDRMRETPLSKLSADDERWDEDFLDHPLSKIRARLANVIDTLQLDPEVRDLATFRVAAPPPPRKDWRFWRR